MLLESQFQSQLIQDIKKRFPGAIVLKTDPTYITGFPDLLLLNGYSWAALETKRSENARRGPNQEYYIGKTDEMSYGSFVYPENKKEVLRDLQQALQSNW